MRAIVVLLVVGCSASAQTGPKPLDPPHLAWSMNVERGTAALTAAKVRTEQHDRHAYFDDESGHASHTVEPELAWAIPNGRATARFAWSHAAGDWQLDAVELHMHVTGDQLARELAKLERRHGKPHKPRLWVRGGVWLVVDASTTPDPATHLFSLSVTYRRDDHPPP